MVTTTLKTISKAEKELEQMMDSSSTKDPSEQSIKEMRTFVETATFSALSTTEQWGKKALEKITNKTEDICL